MKTIRIFGLFVFGSGLLLGELTLAAQPVQMQRSTLSFCQGCNVSMARPKGSDSAKALAVDPLPKAWRSSMGEIRFFVGCYDKDDPSVGKTLAWFDADTKKWIKNEAEMERSLLQSLPLQEDEKFRKEIIRTTKIFDIRTKNAHGWAMTGEDLIGDERFRKRGMAFCLFRSAKVLCGNGDVAYVEDGPKGDLTPYALEILRSIEFLDDAPSTP